jgi:hypothetical protein
MTITPIATGKSNAFKNTSDIDTVSVDSFVHMSNCHSHICMYIQFLSAARYNNAAELDALIKLQANINCKGLVRIPLESHSFEHISKYFQHHVQCPQRVKQHVLILVFVLAVVLWACAM